MEMFLTFFKKSASTNYNFLFLQTENKNPPKIGFYNTNEYERNST